VVAASQDDQTGGIRQVPSWRWLPKEDRLEAEGLAQTLGLSPDDLATGSALIDRIHPDDRARHEAALRDGLEGRAPFQCASRLRATTGEFLWIFFDAVAVPAADGRLLEMRGEVHRLGDRDAALPPDRHSAVASILSDVWSAGVAALEDREAEHGLRLAAEENVFSQREFFSTVSHEIRNPLTVIFANIETLRFNAQRLGDEAQIRRLSTIERASKHLRDLVTDVLDLAKAEAGAMKVELDWFEVADLLGEIEEMGLALTRGGAVRFAVEAPTELGRMFGDRLKLKQVLLNLIGNAVKFTKEGQIILRVSDEPNSLIFAVEDTGMGIPADQLEGLFKAFSQVGGSHAPRSGSTGLGLAISDRYVRLMSGRLSVASQLGQGSVFDFALPRVVNTRVDRIPPARREDRLVIGHTEELGTLDPHKQMRATNAMIARHHFEALTIMDPSGRIGPGLAESWEPMGNDGWRFHLRRGVRFHDGSVFDGCDVLATFARLRQAAGAAAYAAFLKPVTAIATPDPFTLEMRTSVPSPLLPVDMSHVAIIHRRFQDAESGDFDDLTATVGTGAFRLRGRAGNRMLNYSAFADHWAGRPVWQEVEFRLIDESGLASVSALLAGDVDLIDNVGPDQCHELMRRDDVELTTCDSNRVWYLYFDQVREVSPWITDREGQPLASNPLKDPRVRRAISYAVDREFITTRLMAGQGRLVGDLAGPGVFGVNPVLVPPPYDPGAARRLLADAGYPEGFAITLHGSKDRSFHGATTLRAIGLMLNAVGIKCKPEALPASEFYPRAAKGDFSFGLSGWGSITGETSYSQRMLLCTPDPARGFGGVNRGGYSNTRFDALVGEAVAEMNAERRRGLLEAASAIAMADVAIAPICARRTTWASKRGIRYVPQADGATLAAFATRDAAE
jgi:peptide/nickel transport system substrate-binding protein